MSEINPFSNPSLNMEQLIGNVVHNVVEKAVEIQHKVEDLETSDEKSISLKNPKNINNPNLSFIENQPVIVGIAVPAGISIPSVNDTRQLLSIGFSIVVNLLI